MVGAGTRSTPSCPRKIYLDKLLVEVYDCRKVRRFQGRAANQAAVDFFHSHQLFAVACVHAAAVLNAKRFRALAAEHFPNRFTNERDGFVCLFSGCRSARTDCPNGFVSDDDLGDALL